MKYGGEHKEGDAEMGFRSLEGAEKDFLASVNSDAKNIVVNNSLN